MATEFFMGSRSVFLLVMTLLACPFSSSNAQVQAHSRRRNSSVSAVFAFGDSTLDAGNNNYLITYYKSNFPPYGKDFFGHKPTGRFSNGRLLTDFAASYIGLKETVPAYLDNSLSLEDLKTGVCFASAGSGFDPLTAQINEVISMPQQMNYFREYLARLERMLGKITRDDIISRAVFVLSAGTNDFAANYILLPFRRQSFSLEAYQAFLLQNVKKILQELYNLGSRKAAVVGLPPLGCLPIVITLFAENRFHNRACIDEFNSIAIDYNKKLQALLNKSSALEGIHLVYVDVYTPLIDMISSPFKYGFEESLEGCCGTGLFEAAFGCNFDSSVCSDASKYVFWDSIHPTERTYYALFNYFRPLMDNFLKRFY